MSDAPTYVEGFHDLQSCEKVKYRKFGNTDMMVSHIGIGGCPAGNMYGEIDEQLAINVIVQAVKSGINFVDTAPYYGFGRSEEIFGKALRQIPRKCYYIATKVGRYGPTWPEMFDFSAKRVKETVDLSLKRLGVDCIDLIQVHDLEFVDDLKQIWEETIPALVEVVKAGKARYIGVNGYPLATLQTVIENAKTPVHSILCYSRGNLINNDIQKFVPFFQSRGMGIINASITSMGLLTSSGPQSWHPAPKEIQDTGRAAFTYSKSKGVDLGRLAVQFAVRIPGVHIHMLGCNDIEMLRRNFDAATSEQTDLEKQISQDVQKMFDKFEQTHFEGVEIKRYKQIMAEHRNKK